MPRHMRPVGERVRIRRLIVTVHTVHLPTTNCRVFPCAARAFNCRRKYLLVCVCSLAVLASLLGHGAGPGTAGLRLAMNRKGFAGKNDFGKADPPHQNSSGVLSTPPVWGNGRACSTRARTVPYERAHTRRCPWVSRTNRCRRTGENTTAGTCPHNAHGQPPTRA